MTTMSPPVSPRPHDARPQVGKRSSTMASITSSKSRRSLSSNKNELVETSKDKRRLNEINDPTKALSEKQPVAIALEESTLEDLRDIRHKDSEGNIINDPDRSNPTRHRFERPLDTIRSFNAAADGTTYRRSSSYGNSKPAQGNQEYSRRSSYYANGYSQPPHRPRPGAGGYYRNSSYGFRPENSFPEDVPHPPYGRPPRQQSQTQPYYDHGESPGSGHSYGHSYETMTSGSEEYGKSTNPSSQNSSVDQLHQLHQQRKQEEQQRQHLSQYDNDIQFSQPTSNGAEMHNPAAQDGQSNLQQSQQRISQHFAQQAQQQAQQQQDQQQSQRRQPQTLRRPGAPPSSYNNRPQQSSGAVVSGMPSQSGVYQDKPLPPQKRQSWIKRTFSRRS